MKNTFIFLRHTETEIDKDKPVSQWHLSTKGRLNAEMLAKGKKLKPNVIVCSDEDKTFETALPIAKKYGLDIDRFLALNELNRDKGGFLTAKSWQFAVKYAMKNPDKSKFAWEKASNALDRFSEKIEELDLAYVKKKILVVSHGLVLHLYFANKLGKMHEAYERLMQGSFGEYGIIKDGKVIVDLLDN